MRRKKVQPTVPAHTATVATREVECLLAGRKCRVRYAAVDALDGSPLPNVKVNRG